MPSLLTVSWRPASSGPATGPGAPLLLRQTDRTATSDVWGLQGRVGVICCYPLQIPCLKRMRARQARYPTETKSRDSDAEELKDQLFRRLRLYPHSRRRVVREPSRMSQSAMREWWVVRLRLSSRILSFHPPQRTMVAYVEYVSEIKGKHVLGADWRVTCTSRVTVVDRCSVE